MKTVFIDGSAGTTGLRIRERLSARRDISLVVLDEAKRKNPAARKAALDSADVAFLCLPDDAAREAVAMIENPSTVVIDTSTAHRTNDDWVYGLPELPGFRDKIRASQRIANPGCHASGIIALVSPLVLAGVLPPKERFCAFSLTGYSGGGKKMIAEYEEHLAGDVRRTEFLGGRQYALGGSHKHLPEVVKICGIDAAPVFSPIIVPHFSGMQTTVMLHRDQIVGGLEAVRETYRALYSSNGVISFIEPPSAGRVLSSAVLTGRDDMQIEVQGDEDRIKLIASFDNLGKGASGAAIQNMNIAIGANETEGLVV